MASTSLVISSVSHPAANYPGLEYSANETNAVYFEDREVSGILYRVQNASFNGTLWTQSNTALPSFAIAQNPDGSVSFLTKPLGQVTGWTTATWNGNGVRGVFNVRDFGAKGDGVTNDAPSIQAAATAAAVNGGVVYCPAGNYLIYDVILLGNNTTLRGDGPLVSKLSANGGMNGGVISGQLNIAMVANSRYTESHPGTTWQENIFIYDMGFYGNASNNIGNGTTDQILNGLITFQGVNNQGVYRCLVQSSSNQGVQMTGTLNQSFWNPAVTGNFHIVDCTIDLLSDYANPASNVSGFPIRGEGLGQGFASGNLIGFANLAQTNDAMDFPGCSGMIVTNNQMTKCGNGIGTNSTLDVIVTNNFVLNPGGYGIAAFMSGGNGTNRFIVSDNIIEKPGSIAIRVTAPASGIVISDNTITFDQPTVVGAIDIDVNFVICHHNTIDLQESASTGIRINASNIIVDSNYVFNGGSSGAGSVGVNVVTPQSGVKVTNNNLVGTTTPLVLSGTGVLTDLTSSVIRNNDGVNPHGGFLALNPAVPGSGSTLTNPFPFDCIVYIVGGSGVGVFLQGDATGLGSGIGYPVPAAGTILLNYSAAPTWTWLGN